MAHLLDPCHSRTVKEHRDARMDSSKHCGVIRTRSFGKNSDNEADNTRQNDQQNKDGTKGSKTNRSKIRFHRLRGLRLISTQVNDATCMTNWMNLKAQSSVSSVDEVR
ncbi:MAG: hypothetical protein A2289_13315 [Deltaproteobacteria bacterium RIFOXYA12_FULL_58_15]|nr:MAG: hypothetical protein A2289_13315 [Deltaproteobacteria bacterium RIFOXYA12_FULL_58_15]OGR13831.1 MAG: hypothetical protein A2341_01425 [Deltaproteobacteria bacterium RIFOXYB12_FULL_58_9]